MQISVTENTKLSLELFAQEYSEICDLENKAYYKREKELKNYYIYQDGFMYYFDFFCVINKAYKTSFLNFDVNFDLFFDKFDSIIYYFVDHPKEDELLLVMKFGHKNAETN